jgi:DNA-binding FadR family transcriptional regulator
VVETGAAEHAAARALTDAEVDHLQRLLDLTTAAEPTQYRRCDSRLHLAVAELSGSTSVTAAVADARMALNTQLDAIPLLTHNIRHSDRQHRRIVDAILSGQPVAPALRWRSTWRAPLRSSAPFCSELVPIWADGA